MVILMPYLRYVATDPRVYVINGEKTSTVLNILRSRPSNRILISNELAGILNCQIFGIVKSVSKIFRNVGKRFHFSLCFAIA